MTNNLSNAPMVLCFHGLGGSISQFGLLTRTLISAGFEVCRFGKIWFLNNHADLSDCWGHGQSSDIPLPGNDLLSLFAKQAYDLILALGANKREIHILGFSLGCLVAAEFYYKYTQTLRLGRLVMLAPPGFGKRTPKWARYSCLFINPVPR